MKENRHKQDKTRNKSIWHEPQTKGLHTLWLLKHENSQKGILGPWQNVHKVLSPQGWHCSGAALIYLAKVGSRNIIPCEISKQSSNILTVVRRQANDILQRISNKSEVHIATNKLYTCLRSGYPQLLFIRGVRARRQPQAGEALAYALGWTASVVFLLPVLLAGSQEHLSQDMLARLSGYISKGWMSMVF